MNFWDDLASFADSPALITETDSLSHAALAAQADLCCSSVRAGLAPGVTRPLILLEAVNEPGAVIAYLAALRAGWPVILVAEGAAGPDSQIAQTYQPNIVMRRATGWQPQPGAPDPIAMHPDLAVLLSTSGTTGAAKLVRLSRQNLDANAAAIARYLDVRPQDRAITLLPFHYSYGLSVLHIHLRAGAAVVLTEASLIDTGVQALARRCGVTSLALVPTQFELLDQTGWLDPTTGLPGLRCITQAGGRIDPGLARRFAALAQAQGWQLFIMYGQTEAAPRMSYVPPEAAQDWFHTIGRPIDGGSFRLLDATGAEISGTGISGDLIYEGPNVMLGYALTRAGLDAPAGPAVLATGDMAERLDNGYFRLTGRASRFIKLFGLRIGLDEVESQLRAEGQRVYVSGTDARLVIFADEGADMPALQDRVAARYRLPRSAVLVTALGPVPLLASGKVDYRSLGQRAATLRPDPRPDLTPDLDLAPDMTAHPAPDTGTELRLRQALRQTLRLASPDPDRSFLDLSGDSLAYLEMQLHLLDLLGKVPARWETMPLRQLIALQRPPPPPGTPPSLAPAAAWQAVPADLLARIAAILAVIALHSTTWPTGGGAYLLLILAGYSLARFQSGVLFDGDILRTWRSMLIPILICYYLLISLITLLWAPVGAEWFLLLGNFQDKIALKGLIPYWFVSTYVQVIVMASLPFAVPALRRQIARQPFAAGLAVLAVLVLAIALSGVADIPPQSRHRHPLAAMELLMLGWSLAFARSPRQKLGISVVALGVLWISWRDVSTSTAALILLGAGPVVWGLHLRLPVRVAQGLMRIGALTLFVYLVHVPIISIVSRLAPGPDLLQFCLVTATSLIAAFGLKAAYDRGFALLTASRVR